MGIVSTSVMHHGKRVRFSATYIDDNPEAFKAALDELSQKVRPSI